MLGVVASMFSVLLIATGIAKLRRPQDTARALAATHVPLPREATYLLASLEIAVGCTALVAPTAATLGAQTVMYALFLGWVIVALRLEVPLASCGCLGRDDTQPYWGHVVVNVVALVASAVTARTGSLLWAAESRLGLATNLFLVAAGAWLAWHVIDTGAVARARRTT